MPYRFLCNDVQREGIKPSPGLASGLFCYASLHNIWYGIPLILYSTLWKRTLSKVHDTNEHEERC